VHYFLNKKKKSSTQQTFTVMGTKWK